MIVNTPSQNTLSQVKAEALISKYIPYAHLYNSETIETKSGHLLQVIRIDGLPAETMDDDLIHHEKMIRNTLLKSIADSSFSIYFHNVRKRVNQKLEFSSSSKFAIELDKKWQEKIRSKSFYTNQHYITIVKKPPTGKIRSIVDIAKSLSGKLDREARNLYREKSFNDLERISDRIVTNLAHYGACKLGMNTNGKFSDLLGFIAYLINLEERNIVPFCADLSCGLSFKRLFFDAHSGTLALRNLTNESKFAAILSIKDYVPETDAGMLDILLDIPAEMVITQTFSFIDKGVARSKIREQQRNQAQSDDGVTSETRKIDLTLDALGSTDTVSGHHHFTVSCHAETREKLEAAVKAVDVAFNSIGILAVREDRGIKPAFFAMLPANHAYIARKALITSHNVAGLASIHNSSCGKAKGNYWGDAVTMLETRSGSPFYFNFHAGDVANTFLIGPMGSGKTLLEAFLLAQSMKFGGRLIIFDKDQGLEVFVRAMDGKYSTMTPGERTGFAPFQMEDTPENRHFLMQLLRKMAGASGKEPDDMEVSILQSAIEMAYQLPKSKRILRNIVPFLGARKNGSLRMRFEQWVEEGQYAWVFDNETDHFSLDAAVTGFDMTNVFADEFILPFIYFYQFHRIEQQLDGTRTRIVVAEGWRALEDDIFRAQIRDWSSTPRKKEAFLVMDTQSPNDLAQSEVGCKVIAESATQIYFANPQAEYEDYVVRFRLTEKEFSIIRTLDKNSHFFLLKQGKHSVVVRADLGGFDEIAVLSGRKKYQSVLLEAIRTAGDDPEKWLPLYYEGIRRQSHA